MVVDPALVLLLEYREDQFLLAGLGDESFAVVPVLDFGEGAARGAEVFEDPGGEALEESLFFELVAPSELVFVETGAELFGPDLVGVSVIVN